MFNNYNTKRAKTSNFKINNPNNQFHPSQSNTFRDIYINQFPTYYNQYGYENTGHSKHLAQPHYIKRQKTPEEFFGKEEHFENTMKNLHLKPDYFIKKLEQKNEIGQRSVKTFINQSPNKLNHTAHYIYRNNNDNLNKIGKSHETKVINYNEYDQGLYKVKKFPKKFYKNKPLKKKSEHHNEDNNLEKSEDSSQPVAQKICNIIIKGVPKKDKTKKLKSDKKKKTKGFSIQNMEIEGNVSHGSVIAKKNVNLNKNSKNSQTNKMPSSSINNKENNIQKKEEIIQKTEIRLSGKKKSEKITPQKENKIK